MTRCAAFALLLCSSCASLGPIIYVDERFSTSESEEIRAAGAAWETATGGAVHVDLVFGARVAHSIAEARVSKRREIERLEEAETLDDWELGRPAVVANELGNDVYGFERIAVVPSRLGGWSLRTIVMHELGHHFGMQHIADPFALMSGNASRSIEVFAFDECISHADAIEISHQDVDVTHVRECIAGVAR